MKSAIVNTSLRTFIQTVKLDHIIWKGNVYALASGLSKSAVFKKREEPHKGIHQNGVLALKMIQKGEKK